MKRDPFKIETCKYANNLDQTSEIGTADIFQKMQNFPSSEKGKRRRKLLVYFNGALLVFFPHIYFSHFFSHSGIGKELGKLHSRWPFLPSKISK